MRLFPDPWRQEVTQWQAAAEVRRAQRRFDERAGRYDASAVKESAETALEARQSLKRRYPITSMATRKTIL